jgi:hypothetical protein
VKIAGNATIETTPLTTLIKADDTTPTLRFVTDATITNLILDGGTIKSSVDTTQKTLTLTNVNIQNCTIQDIRVEPNRVSVYQCIDNGNNLNIQFVPIIQVPGIGIFIQD